MTQTLPTASDGALRALRGLLDRYHIMGCGGGPEALEAARVLRSHALAPTPAQDPVTTPRADTGDVERLRVLSERATPDQWLVRATDLSYPGYLEIDGGDLGARPHNTGWHALARFVAVMNGAPSKEGEANAAFACAAVNYVRTHVLAPPASAADGEGLLALRERVLAAKGADRELNEAIHDALFPHDPWWQAMKRGRELVAAGKPDEVIQHNGSILRAETWALSSRVADYTGSFDDSDRLVQEALGDWKLGTAAPDPGRHPIHGKAWAKVEPYVNNDEGWKAGAFDSRAATVPLSICAAVLTAKAALAGGQTHG